MYEYHNIRCIDLKHMESLCKDQPLTHKLLEKCDKWILQINNDLKIQLKGSLNAAETLTNFFIKLLA